MDFGAIASAAIQGAIALVGEENARKMSKEQLALLAQQMSDVKGIPLPHLDQAIAEQLGPSAVGSMQSDQLMRAKQLRALSEIQNIADKGGMDATDAAAFEEATGRASADQHRAREGVKASLQSRGQLNSGTGLMMDLDAAQVGSNTERQKGFERAAQAQERRLRAIREASSMAGGMREQDWREGESSARARDIRDERNAAARESANRYNLGIPQQTFNNALAKTGAAAQPTNALSGAYGNAATDARAAAAGQAGIVGAAYNGITKNAAAEQPATPNTYEFNVAESNDINGNRGGYLDLSSDDDK